MNDWITITLIIFAEFALVEFFYIVYLFKKKISGNSVDIEKARQVYLELTQDSRRKEKLMPELENLYEVAQDQREEVAEKIIQCENTLYRGIIKAIATGDLDIKDLLNNKDANASAEFQNLTQQLKEKKQEIIDAIKDEIREITNDRDQLRDELKNTLEAMDRTLNEYANMYSVKSKEQEEEFLELKQTVNNVTQHANYTIKKSGKISSLTDTENPTGKKKKKTATKSEQESSAEPELKEIDTQRIDAPMPGQPAENTAAQAEPNDIEAPQTSDDGSAQADGESTSDPAEDVDIDAALEGFDLGDIDDEPTENDAPQNTNDTAVDETEKKVKQA